MSGQGRTILLVDDESFTLNAVATILRGAGHEVHVCEQWACVSSTVRKHNPDLVLLDYNMPALTGDKICEILKRNSVDSDMRVFLFSSEPEAELRSITASCGADGYIKKDVPAQELLTRVLQITAAT